MAELIGGLIQRLGYLFGRAIHAGVTAFMQAVMYIGKIVLSFVAGIIEELFASLPGITSDQALQAASFARTELEKWNNLFPIYEAFGCLTIIFTFRMTVALYRTFMTMLWNGSNLHNLLPKIGGTG